jgi:hypothetical protein
VTKTASQLTFGDHITGIPGVKTLPGDLLVHSIKTRPDGNVDVHLRQECSVGYLQPIPMTLPADLTLRIKL